MKVFMIANPKSGKGAAHMVVPKVREFFSKNHVDIDVYITKKVGDAIGAAKKAARSGKYDVIIASGGDGTLNEVINGIMLSGRNKEQKFGIIPLGTENVLAQEKSIPFNAIKAAKLIILRKTTKIDIGKAGKRYFFLMAGVGFDAHVATKVKPLLKRIVGSVAYPLAAWGELFRYKHSDITIKIDGKKTSKGSFVVIGNTKLYGGKLRMTPHADMHDGLLDVCLFKGKDIFSFLRYAAGTLTAQHIRFSDIEYYKAKTISVSAKPRALCHVDCEILGNTPIKVKVCPNAINLIVK